MSPPRSPPITGQTADDVQKIVADALAENADSQFAYLEARPDDRAVPGSRGSRRAVPHLRRAPGADLPRRRRRRQPRRLHGRRRRGARPASSRARTTASPPTDGTPRVPEGQGRCRHPRAPRCSSRPSTAEHLQLTINRDLQWYLQQLIGEQAQDMAAKRGTITVVEVKTGKIRAAAEFPTVDPNDPEASETETAVQPHLHRPVRARIDLQGADRGDRASTPAVRTPSSTVVASDWETFANGARVTRRVQSPRVHLHARRRAHRLVERGHLEVQRAGEPADALRLPAEVRHRQRTAPSDSTGRRRVWSTRPTSGTTSSCTTPRSDRASRPRCRSWPARTTRSPTAACGCRCRSSNPAPDPTAPWSPPSFPSRRR